MALLNTMAGVQPRRKTMHPWRAGLAALMLWAAAASDVAAQTAASREYQIKAVFLFNFAQFVDWPHRAFSDEKTPLVIGVLGDDPFGASLDSAVQDEKVNGRALVVRRFRRVEDIDTCHVLFISRSETPRLDRIMANLQGRSILTVSDTDEFMRRAGMIRFVTENNKVRLHINVDAARAAELTISSKLLRPAEIVTAAKG